MEIRFFFQHLPETLMEASQFPNAEDIYKGNEDLICRSQYGAAIISSQRIRVLFFGVICISIRLKWGVYFIIAVVPLLIVSIRPRYLKPLSGYRGRGGGHIIQ